MRYLAPLLIGVLGVAVLLGLGRWQVERMAWKEGLLAEIAATIGSEPVAIPARPDPVTHRFLAVAATGTLGAQELRVLVSTKEQGAGYRLIRALEIDGDRRVLADLGYVPTVRKDGERPGGPVTLTGNMHWPDERDSYTPENDVAGNIWFARDLDAMAAELGTEPVLVVARRLEPGKDVQPLPLSEAGIPNDHLGYAVTWFGLAAVWAGMTGFWIWRMARRADGQDMDGDQK